MKSPLHVVLCRSSRGPQLSANLYRARNIRAFIAVSVIPSRFAADRNDSIECGTTIIPTTFRVLFRASQASFSEPGEPIICRRIRLLGARELKSYPKPSQLRRGRAFDQRSGQNGNAVQRKCGSMSLLRLRKRSW